MLIFGIVSWNKRNCQEWGQSSSLCPCSLCDRDLQSGSCHHYSYIDSKTWLVMGSFSHKCVYVFAIYLLSPNPQRSPPGGFIKNVDVPVRVSKLAGWTEVNCWVKVEFLLGFSALLLSCTAQFGTLFFEDGYTKNLLTFDLCHWRSFFSITKNWSSHRIFLSWTATDCFELISK